MKQARVRETKSAASFRPTKVGERCDQRDWMGRSSSTARTKPNKPDELGCDVANEIEQKGYSLSCICRISAIRFMEDLTYSSERCMGYCMYVRCLKIEGAQRYGVESSDLS